jgi:integrase
VQDTRVGGHKNKPDVHAYTWDEVAVMLEKLPEPARTISAVSAFTGLTRSELRGLRWKDYDVTKMTLTVSQKIVGTQVGPPKTHARASSVPIIKQLAAILKDYRKEFPGNEDDFVFQGERMRAGRDKMFALNQVCQFFCVNDPVLFLG